MAYGTVNADVIGTSVSGSNLGAGNASIMKNRIINGAMVVNQRATTITDYGYATDRWSYNPSTAGKASVAQSSTAPAGFNYSLLSTSSAATTVGSTDIYIVEQKIEGYNVADLNWGTANAKTVTLSFWVYSSLTGTFGGALGNAGPDRSYPFNYTISSANTWTYITVTIPGDTTGTWNATNGAGIRVIFSLGSGSTRSATANAWTGTSNIVQPTGSLSLLATNGATLYLTGVQLEVGSSATGYEYRQYGQELALCLRYYYYQVIPNGNFGGTIGANQTTTVSWFPIQNVFRATPTATYSGALSVIQGNSQSNVTSVAALHYAQNAVNVALTCGAILTAGYSTNLYANGSTSYLNLSAEL